MTRRNLRIELESDVVKRIKQYLEENGIFKTFLWFTRKLLERIWYTIYRSADYNLAVIRLDTITKHQKKNERDWQCKELQVEDLEDLENRFGKTVSETFAKRIENSTGYLIFDKDEIAGYAWCCYHLLRNEGVKPFLIDLKPKKEMLYMYDFFIRPEKRNKNALTTLLNYILYHSKVAGFKKAFFTFNKRNLAMKSIASKLGFEIDGQISCRRYIGIIVKQTSALEQVCEFVK